MPLLIRVDGKAFHTLTRHAIKPFDNNIMNARVNAAITTLKSTQGCKLVYMQLDEVTFLLTDYESYTTDTYFKYNTH